MDAAENRLKLPLSLCQEENAQLYFPAEETEQWILCGRQLSGLILSRASERGGRRHSALTLLKNLTTKKRHNFRVKQEAGDFNLMILFVVSVTISSSAIIYCRYT